MDLKVREISESFLWDEFVKSSPNCNFMQSWNWSMFQEVGLSRKTYRLGFWNAVAVSN